MLAKPELRKEMSGKRSVMSLDKRLKASFSVLENLERLEEFQHASDILAYLSLPEEVRTDEIIEKVIEKGRRIYVPLVSKQEIWVSRIPGMNIKFKYGSFGIREPKKEYWDLRSSKDLDLAIIPGLAFDRSPPSAISKTALIQFLIL